MKKILSLAAFALMTSMAFVACSSDDDNNTQPTPEPTPTPPPTPTPTPANPFIGTWSLVNDADKTLVTEIVMSTEPYQNYSATLTTVNPTIPEGTPSFKTISKTFDATTGAPLSYTMDEGYFTMPAPIAGTNAAGEATSTIPTKGTITFWPQSSMTSVDGSTWTAATTGAVKEEYSYQLNGIVMILTRGDNSTRTFILQTGAPASPVPGDAFFKSWILPNDADPTTVVDLLISAEATPDYGPAPATPNPSIPADAPYYTKTTKYDFGVLVPGIPAMYEKEIGRVSLPAASTSGTTTTRPGEGNITFWPQKLLSSTDGTTWTEATPTVTMEEYTYRMESNVMTLTTGDKKGTFTYYTLLLQ